MRLLIMAMGKDRHWFGPLHLKKTETVEDVLLCLGSHDPNHGALQKDIEATGGGCNRISHPEPLATFFEKLTCSYLTQLSINENKPAVPADIARVEQRSDLSGNRKYLSE